MYSGFSDDFKLDIKPFLNNSTGPVDNVALLLQGGPGYERYLEDYIEPMKWNGVEKINIIVPDAANDELSRADIEIIRRADSVFIGGGYTPRYAELYAIEEIIEILKYKNKTGVNIGGLSAGSLIMNDIVKSEGKELNGFGLVHNMFIFPHFEEETYGYDLIKHVVENKNDCCYGIETNAYLEIDIKGTIKKMGNGRVYKAISLGNGKAELFEILP